MSPLLLSAQAKFISVGVVTASAVAPSSVPAAPLFTVGVPCEPPALVLLVGVLSLVRLVGKPTNAAAEITPTATITRAPSTPTRMVRPLPQWRTVLLMYSTAALYPASVMAFPLPVRYPPV